MTYFVNEFEFRNKTEDEKSKKERKNCRRDKYQKSMNEIRF